MFYLLQANRFLISTFSHYGQIVKVLQQLLILSERQDYAYPFAFGVNYVPFWWS